MNLNDPVGDLITRIRNAQMRGRATVTSPASTLRTRLLDVLVEEGYVRGYGEIEKDGKKELEIQLKYYEGAPVITEIARVSKPGRRVYSAAKELRPVLNGLGISVISSSRGVISDREAR